MITWTVTVTERLGRVAQTTKPDVSVPTTVAAVMTARKPVVPAVEDAMLKPAAFLSASATNVSTAQKPIVSFVEDAMMPAAFPSASATAVGTVGSRFSLLSKM